MIPKHLNKAYAFNALLYGFVAILFSLSISWFLLGHIYQVFDWKSAIIISSLTLFTLILAWTFKKITLILVLLLFLLRSLYIYFSEDLTFQMFFSPIEDYVRMINDSIYWMIMPPGEKPFGIESSVPQVVYLLSSILSFLVLWLRPLPYVALTVLVVPLFFYEGLEEITEWIGMLFVGLFAVLMSFGYKGHLKNSRSSVLQVPSLILVSFVLLASVLTYQYLPGELFYSQRANTWINDTFGEGAKRNIAPFSLEDVGFNNTLGGPITLSPTPFMEVYGPNETFYLRGSVYDDYDHNRWSKSQDNLYELFDDTPENRATYHRVFNTSNLSLEGADTISIIPRQDSTRVLFHSGFPLEFRFPNSQIKPTEGAPDYGITFNDLGDIFTSRPVDDNGYDITGILTSQRGPLNPDDLSLGEDQVTEIPELRRLDSKGTRYKALLEAYDPELAEIIYSDDDDLYNPFLRAVLLKNRLQSFNYTLDVAPLEEGEDVVEYLFRTKEGYCTYYATALALILRDAGIETRYAEGFIALANLNSTDEFYHRVILESQAHAWTEVFVEGYGYLPMDATPSNHVEDLSVIPLEEEETTEPSTNEPILPPEDRPIIEQDEFSDVDFEELDFSDEEPLDITKHLWLLLPLYLLWRLLVYRLRHNKKYLKLRYNPTTLVKKVWPDLLHLYELQGIKLSNEDTLRTSLLKVLSENSFWSYWNDQEEREGILTMLEEVHFAGKEATTTHLDEFLDYYNSVELKTKQKIPRPMWILRRFLWSRRHPL